MFGLSIPVTKSLASADFDGLQTIIFNSGLKEPPQWLSKVNRKGEIFQLELEDNTDLQTLQTSNKECVCSDCPTDDTGYGTDNDVYTNLYRTNGNCDNIGEVLNCSDKHFHDSCSTRDNDIHKVERDIDYLFEYTNNVDQLACGTVTSRGRVHLDIDTSSLDDSSSNTSFGCTDIQDLSIQNLHAHSRNHENAQNDFKAPSTMSSENCICTSSNKEQSIKHNIEINLKLYRKSLWTKNGQLSRVEICEKLFGIVPGHFGSEQTSENHRKKDRRVKIKGIVPFGVASKHCNIKVGDCLLAINDHEVTWNNLASTLKGVVNQEQVKLVIARNPKLTNSSSSLLKKRNISSIDRLVQLVTGSNTNAALDDVLNGKFEPFYEAMYLSLKSVSSEMVKTKEDVLYQFPKVDNKVIASRGMFITLTDTLFNATQSVIQSTTLRVNNSQVNVVYQLEGHNLFVMSAQDKRFSVKSLTSLVKDVVRLLQIHHGSVHHAFTSTTNHSQLDCFFALLHQNHISPSHNGKRIHCESCNRLQSLKFLSLPNDIKLYADRVLTDFEAADNDTCDNSNGCRRNYNILGTCIFYKNYLICNHLPKDDLIDFSIYLKYHSLLNLNTDHSLGQLVVWRQVHPTRHCHAVPEEQQFGYTEPLIAKWFWLIFGYKHFILCVSLETGGCTRVVHDVSAPDSYLIDHARAVLLQLYGQNVATHCQNSLSKSSFFIQHDMFNELQRHDPIAKSLQKLPPRDFNSNNSFRVIRSNNEISGSLRRNSQKRNDSVESDNSSESSGESLFKFSGKHRLFHESSDVLQNMTTYRDDISLINTSRKLTAGSANCLFQFLYLDNIEGVLVSSEAEVDTFINVNQQIYTLFHKCCQRIKQLFDKVKEQNKTYKKHVLGLNEDFATIRQEGIMFACSEFTHNKKMLPLHYWVVGRCLAGAMREIYVCFHESVPQTAIELAFKLALGYQPL